MMIKKLFDDFETAIDYNEYNNIKAIQELNFDENKEEISKHLIKNVCNGQRDLLNKMRNKFKEIAKGEGCGKELVGLNGECGDTFAGDIELCDLCEEVAKGETKEFCDNCGHDIDSHKKICEVKINYPKYDKPCGCKEFKSVAKNEPSKEEQIKKEIDKDYEK